MNRQRKECTEKRKKVAKISRDKRVEERESASFGEFAYFLSRVTFKWAKGKLKKKNLGGGKNFEAKSGLTEVSDETTLRFFRGWNFFWTAKKNLCQRYPWKNLKGFERTDYKLEIKFLTLHKWGSFVKFCLRIIKKNKQNNFFYLYQW
jgi:hypothetical protein